MDIADFKKDICRGKAGEDFFLKVLGDEEGDSKIIDVSDDKDYQDCDIDFVLVKNGKKYCIEVKTDSYISKNMFYEEISCKETHSLGCFNKTCANILLYYFPKMEIVYVFYNINKFREWFNINKEKFRVCQIPNKRKDGIYNALGRLIPLADIDKYQDSVSEKERFAKKVSISIGLKSELLNIVDLTEPYEINECVKMSPKVRIRPQFRNIR